MEQKYNVSSNPHVRDGMTTSRIMQLVVIALLPATLFGIWNFGFRAFLVVAVTVASSVIFEWLYDHFMHSKGFQRSCYRTSSCYEHAGADPAVDAGSGKRIFYYCSKTAFWRTGTELYEPGSCRKVFPDDFLCRKNDRLCSVRSFPGSCGYCHRSHSSGSSENPGICRRYLCTGTESVFWKYPGNHRRDFRSCDPYRRSDPSCI